jgi:hypothetical protein
MSTRHILKRGIASIALVVSVLAFGAGPAGAAQPVGRCNQSFTMVAAGTHGAEGRAIDKNGDGWVCEKPLPGGNVGLFNVTDNNASL